MSMGIRQFRDLCKERIPTAREFLAFVEAQGWRVAQKEDGRPVLKVQDRNDPLAVALARMLSREPYRTNVLGEMRIRCQPQARVLPPLAKPEAPLVTRDREWLWRHGHRHREEAADTTYRREDWHPVGAFWWRYVGEQGWRAVAGRNTLGFPAPEGEEVIREGA